MNPNFAEPFISLSYKTHKKPTEICKMHKNSDKKNRPLFPIFALHFGQKQNKDKTNHQKPP